MAATSLRPVGSRRLGAHIVSDETNRDKGYCFFFFNIYILYISGRSLLNCEHIFQKGTASLPACSALTACTICVLLEEELEINTRIAFFVFFFCGTSGLPQRASFLSFSKASIFFSLFWRCHCSHKFFGRFVFLVSCVHSLVNVNFDGMCAPFVLLFLHCVFAQGLGSGYCFNFALGRCVSTKWANTGARRGFLFLVPLSASSARRDHSGHVRLGSKNRTDAQRRPSWWLLFGPYSFHPSAIVRIHLFLRHILWVGSAIWPRVQVCSTGMALVCLA